MRRNVDVRCAACGYEEANVILAEDARYPCPRCNAFCEQIWWSRSRGPAQWDDQTAVLVHIDPRTGDVRYPGQHDARLKPGYERVYLRSLREVERFEREHAVRSEMAWFDPGTGRGHDDEYRGQRVTH